MLEDLEKEFYKKIQDVEDMRRKGIYTQEELDSLHKKEHELLKLEEDMDCIATVEMME